MTVKELISALQKMPSDLNVGYIWDGQDRSDVQYLWISCCGRLVLSDGDYVYYDADRPKDAPLRKDVPQWQPKKNK